MNLDTKLWSSSISAPLKHIISQDEWLGHDVQSIDMIINAWIMYGDAIYIKPVLDNAATAKFFYQTNGIIRPVTGSNKSEFTIDTDVFPVDNRVLRLGIIWQWKANKGLPYAEDLETYEDALEQAVGKDSGPKTLTVGMPRSSLGADQSFPWTITP